MNNIKTVFLLLLILLSGCRVHRVRPPHANYYYLNTNEDLTTIGRVALIELDNDSAFPQISVDVTEALFQELQKKQLFGLSVIRQTDPAWRSLQLDMDTTYTLEQLSAIRTTLRCNAILIGTVTRFKPYPHMVIGLRLKLIDLDNGQLLWALEQIWDTTDKTTEKRIKNYYSDHRFVGLTTSQGKLASVSSLKFVKFTTYETAETLTYKR